MPQHGGLEARAVLSYKSEVFRIYSNLGRIEQSVSHTPGQATAPYMFACHGINICVYVIPNNQGIDD